MDNIKRAWAERSVPKGVCIVCVCVFLLFLVEYSRASSLTLGGSRGPQHLHHRRIVPVMSQKASIQFIKGVPETVVPNVRLTVCDNVLDMHVSLLDFDL